MFAHRGFMFAFLAATLLLVHFGAGAKSEIPDCPSESVEFRSRPGTQHVDEEENTEASFYNQAQVAVELYWVDFEGQEQLSDSIAPGESTRQSSYVGHAWRMRAEGSGQLFKEHILSQSEEHIEVKQCGMSYSNLQGQDEESKLWLQQHGSRDGPALIDCPLSALLSEVTVRGFHVLCAVVEAGKVERLCVFANGLDQPRCTHSFRVQGGETVDAVIKLVGPQLLTRRPRPRAPSLALFTASGRRLPGHLSFADIGVPEYRRAMVLIEGGEWHWPPVQVGFVRPLHGFVHSGLEGITMKTLSLKPRVFEVKSFIEEKECDRMLEKGGPHVKKSGVVVKDSDHGKSVDEWRTSKNYYLPSEGDSILEALDERVQNLTRIRISHSELAQILKYDYNGRYLAHTDYFDPNHYKSDKGTLRAIANGAHNRLLTVFMYMSNVEKGGETVFPAHGGKPHPSDYSDCSGFRVSPERQKVIIFYNMHPNGDPDPDSLHGGCKVKNGTKWSANFWVWNVEQGHKRAEVHDRMVDRLQMWEERVDRQEEAVVTQLVAGLSADHEARVKSASSDGADEL
ncbi:unnamed protein product [Polarella glacialis]|uniref:Fe2OG dioxygenase domain-containing protein n=1 Tax=Polarella glacialis TaxID=89957 RepID=A0A813JG34_POLGL|nr:unnamed protein product [Polarella glacialis]CAE8676368.1 unnamed protein product [Polarella glacialis]